MKNTRIRSHATKGMAVVGLVLATVTGAEAAGTLIKSSAQIKDGTIRRADLDRRLRAKLDRAARPGPAGPAGVAGPAGARGLDGARGETGAKGDPGAGSSGKGVRIDARTDDIELKPGDDFRTVAALTTTVSHAGLLVGSGAVEVAAPDTEGPVAVVSLRVVHNGHAHLIPSTTTVAPGTRQALAASFQCDLLPGAQDVALQAQVTGGALTVGGRTMDIISATQGQ